MRVCNDTSITHRARFRLFVAFVATAFVLHRPAMAEEHTSYDDGRSPQALVFALYDTISADAGESRDRERFLNLFIGGALLSVALDTPTVSGIIASTPEELLAQAETAYATTGFHELPLETRVEMHGQMATVLSSFEIRLRLDDPAPLMRGLNHFQLLHDGERWWIVSNVGVIETPDAPLPEGFGNIAPGRGTDL